jgi:uncharacterized protein involved in exopolysaccharide biosynthesis
MADAAAAAEYVTQLLRDQHQAAVEVFKRLSDRIDAIAARLETLETALKDIEARNATSLHRPAYVGY